MQAGIPGGELLLAVVGVVVIASVAIHWASAARVSAWYERRVTTATLPEEREGTADVLFGGHDRDVSRITPQELEALLFGTSLPTVLDVRIRSSYERDAAQIPGSIRVLPDQVTEWADNNHPEGLIVTYCT